jgi:hypothetical protein
VSDRALWLEQCCPTCRAAPGSRCGLPYLRKERRPAGLYVARGWRARPCPTCKAAAGEECRTPSGREALRTHEARLRAGRHELLGGEVVWQELEARGATIATVPFSGRAGRGGHVDRIVLSRVDGDELVDVGRWTIATSCATRSRRRCGIASDRSPDNLTSLASSCGRQPIAASSSRASAALSASRSSYDQPGGSCELVELLASVVAR